MIQSSIDLNDLNNHKIYFKHIKENIPVYWLVIFISRLWSEGSNMNNKNIEMMKKLIEEKKQKIIILKIMKDLKRLSVGCYCIVEEQLNRRLY